MSCLKRLKAFTELKYTHQAAYSTCKSHFTEKEDLELEDADINRRTGELCCGFKLLLIAELFDLAYSYYSLSHYTHL